MQPCIEIRLTMLPGAKMDCICQYEGLKTHYLIMSSSVVCTIKTLPPFSTLLQFSNQSRCLFCVIYIQLLKLYLWIFSVIQVIAYLKAMEGNWTQLMYVENISPLIQEASSVLISGGEFHIFKHTKVVWYQVKWPLG